MLPHRLVWILMTIPDPEKPPVETIFCPTGAKGTVARTHRAVSKASSPCPLNLSHTHTHTHTHSPVDL